MRIKTTRQINARTHDGREFTADEDAVVDIDDEDAGLVGLAKVLIMSGQAEHHGDVGTVEDESERVAGDEEDSDPAGDQSNDDDAGDPDGLDDVDDEEAGR